jgi:hypothetical protein
MSYFPKETTVRRKSAVAMTLARGSSRWMGES